MSWDFPKEFKIEGEGGPGRYMRFEDGSNKFRILSEPVFGQVYWKTDGDKRKPVRVTLKDTVPASELEVSKYTGKLDYPRHFMSVVVYNHNKTAVQILEITQQTVNKAIKALIDDKEDWGDPTKYDITVTKTGTGRDTEYTVMPGAQKPLKSSVLEDYEKMDINLQALFEGKDPFDFKEDVSTDDIPF